MEDKDQFFKEIFSCLREPRGVYTFWHRNRDKDWFNELVKDGIDYVMLNAEGEIPALQFGLLLEFLVDNDYFE